VFQIISIDYSALDKASSSAEKAGKKCDSYISNIERKVTNKISSLTLGSNGITSQANYFARQKINDLSRKKREYESFAAKVKQFKEYAQDTDNNVSRYIKSESQKFRNDHDMKTNVITDFFTWATTTLLNKTAFGRWLNSAMRDLGAWIKDKKRKFKAWYHLDGGKYIIKTALAVIGTIVAGIFLVFVAWPALVAAFVGGAGLWTLITAAAGVVTAFVAVVDGVVKASNSLVAAIVFKDDPGWANRYSKMTSLTKWLKETNFKSDFANKWSGIAANIIDTITIVATLINIVDLGGRFIKLFQHIKAKGGLYMVFDKVHFRLKSGKITFGSFKHGAKHLISNLKLAKDFISNTNISRIQKSYESSLKLYSTLKSIENLGKKGQEIAETWLDKGSGKVITDNIKDKILEKLKSHSTSYTVGEKSKKAVKDIIELVNNIKNTNNYYKKSAVAN